MITGSVSRAAKLLGMTQSAASKMLRLLEEEIGITLFERAQQRLVPTPPAQQLHECVEQLHGAYGVVQRMVDSLVDPDHGTVTVAAIPTQATTFLPAAIKHLREDHPGINIIVEILANQPVIERVLNGQADFGLMHDLTPSPDTRNEDIGAQHLVCVAPKGHRYEHLARITPEDLKPEVFLSYGPQTNFGNFVDNAFSQAGYHLPVSVEVTSSAALLAFISAGVGVGVVEPAAIVPFPLEQFIIRPLEPTLRIHSRIVRSRVRPLTRHAELLLNEYRAVVNAAQPDYFCF